MFLNPYRHYDGSTETLVRAMTTPPDETRTRLIDTLIKALKTAGVWDKMDRFYMLAAHDSQAARLNWINPGTDTLTATNSPTFTVDRGYAGNGTTSYLASATNMSAMTHFTRDDAHASVWPLTSASAVNSPDMGNTTVNWPIYGQGRDASGNANFRINQTSNTGCVFAVASSIGENCGVRRGSTATENYKNGVSLGTGTTASVAVAASVMTIGKADTLYYSRQIACADWGSQLSDTEVSDKYAAKLVYLQGVGAA